MSLCLYVVGTPPQRITAALGDFAEMFRRIPVLAERGFETANGRAVTLRARDFSGLIISGSAASVLDGEPWMDDACELIAECARVGTPVLGVCFGHQLIAKTFGGAVRPSAAGLQTGTLPVTVSAADPLLFGVSEDFDANYCHRDEVVVDGELEVLAEGPHSIAAIGYRDAIRGVQFHPEFGRSEVSAYIEEKSNELGEMSAELASSARETPQAVRVVTNFVEAFVGPQT